MLFKTIAWKIKEFIYCLEVFFALAFSKIVYKDKKIVFCECYMCHSIKPFVHHNWGDDLNKYFFEYVSNIKIFNIPFSKIKYLSDITSYSLIGSIITFYNLDKKIIYGSGIMKPFDQIIGIPEKIISVRGPKTREVLLKRGMNC